MVLVMANLTHVTAVICRLGGFPEAILGWPQPGSLALFHMLITCTSLISFQEAGHILMALEESKHHFKVFVYFVFINIPRPEHVKMLNPGSERDGTTKIWGKKGWILGRL